MNKKCDYCEKPLTKENTPDGVNGYSILEEIKEAPGATREKEACRSCYLDYYKKEYPKAKTPKLS